MTNPRQMFNKPHSSFSSGLVSSKSSGGNFRMAFKSHTMSGLKRCLLSFSFSFSFLFLALGGLNAARGDALSDPTLAPAIWLSTQHQGEQGSTALAGQDDSSGVNMIVIGPTRKFAVIDGRVVKLGDTYNGSQVLDIKSGEVVVRDASKSLKLTPAVEKRVVTPAPLETNRKTASKHKKTVKSDGGVQ